ncbi:hypothetical protein VSDG_00845 [Cytospora chrysosperma]|uniref:Uncharacterized protein n=1 Tax=Cytospora chrysosperma TaxID=252740 RepID=A0A423WKP6_CYTCH|nr:hypothetical protein VSDG_00845 [Valsa sordida]
MDKWSLEETAMATARLTPLHYLVAGSGALLVVVVETQGVESYRYAGERDWSDRNSLVSNLVSSHSIRVRHNSQDAWDAGVAGWNGSARHPLLLFDQNTIEYSGS